MVSYGMQAIREGADAVIVVGGDGTLHEVNFMAQSCRLESIRFPPLTPLPPKHGSSYYAIDYCFYLFTIFVMSHFGLNT